MSSPNSNTSASSGPVRIILHGKQGMNPDLHQAVKTLREEGHAIEVRVTWEAGDATLLTRQALQEGVKTVVAGGGDGSINEVANALVAIPEGKQVSFGILPLGTANDFARSNNIPLDPLGALRVVVEQPATAIDIGWVGERSFINVATGGFGTQITVATPEEVKRVLGGAAYLLTGLTQFSNIRPDKGTFHGPEFDWEGEFLVLAIGNGRQAGGGHVLCPGALADDGLLDVRIVPSVPSGEMGNVLNALFTQGMQAISNYIVQAQVPWLEINAPSGMSINLDGEPINETTMRFTIAPQSLLVHLPSDSPLLSTNRAPAAETLSPTP